MGIFDKIGSTLESVGSKLDPYVQTPTKILDNVSDVSTGVLEKSLKGMGLYKPLQLVWQQFGVPVFKITKEMRDEANKKYIKKIPYINNIIDLALTDTRLNQYFQKYTHLNQLLDSLAEGNMRRAAQLALHFGFDDTIDKALPREKRAKYHQARHYQKLASDKDYRERYIENLIDDWKRKGQELAREQAEQMVDAMLKKAFK